MLSLQKKYDTLIYALFSLFILKATAKGACAQVSSTRCTHVKRDRPQPRMKPVTQDHPRAVPLGQIAAKEFACLCFTLLSLLEEVRRVLFG